MDRRSSRARHRALQIALVVGLIVWLGVVSVRSIQLVIEPFTVLGHDASRPNNATPQMWDAAILITLVCLACTLLTRSLSPAATLSVTIAAGGVVVLAAAIGTGSLGSLILVLALFALAWLLGETLLRQFPATPNEANVRLTIAIGLGLGVFGLLLLALATFGWLNTGMVVAGAGIIVLVFLLAGRERLGQDWIGLRAWTSPSPSWPETIIMGLSIGMVSYAALSAFVPEVHSDAVRQHLPIAREIWQTASAGEFPPMWTSRLPVPAHLLYAVAYGLGDMTAAKLVHTLVGLVAILGVAGIAWLGAAPLAATRSDAQRLAAIVAGAIFATMPLVLWELGTAYVDLFPVLFTMASVLAILCWQRDGFLGWLIVAGALAGFGFAAKLTMGLVIVALVAGIGLVGRGKWQWRERIVSVLAFGLGGLVVLPWLLRSYFLTGSLPGLGLLNAQVTRFLPGLVNPGEQVISSATSDLPSFGVGRSPFDIVRIPWQLTLHGDLFHQEGAGDIGIVLLLLLPFVLLVPRTRTMAFLETAFLVSYFGWAFTAQLTRYFLPILALAAAIISIGTVQALVPRLDAKLPFKSRSLLSFALIVGLVLSLAAAPLLLLPKWTAQVPIDLILGKESAEAYIAETVRAAEALEKAGTLLPPDTSVGYFAKWEGAQLYTEARLIYPESGGLTREGLVVDLSQLGTTPEAVLASLDRLGIDYFIWNRLESRPEDWRSTLLSTAFLRTHTRILAGDRSGYLFELLPDGGNWASPTHNLLADADLDTVGEDGPWTVTGELKTRKGLVSLRPKSAISQRVPVHAGTPYLLLGAGSCETAADRALLTLRWFDAHETELETTEEWVIPGTAGSEQFLWHTAPQRATSVAAELTTVGGARCDFDEAELYGPA